MVCLPAPLRRPALALSALMLLAGPSAAQGPAPRPAAPPAAAPAAQPGPPAPAPLQDANRIVGVVNGEVVSRADIVGRARLFALNAGLAIAPETLARLTPQVTRLLIDERLRLQEVQRRRIPVTDADVAEAIAELERRNTLPPGALRAQLRDVGVQPRVLFDQIRTQIGWARLLRQALGPEAQASDADLAEAMRVARARVGEPEFLVSEIFTPVDDPRVEPEAQRFVEQVIGQLRAGAPFPLIATQFSQAQTAVGGGDLGWLRKDELEPEVAAIVERMPPGAISNPIRVPGGFQIVTLRARRESGRDPATLLTVRQAFLGFSQVLDPNAPTDQQRTQVERAQRLAATARSCDAIEAAARAGAVPGADRPVDPGPIRLETVQPQPLKELLGGLVPGRPSQPILTPEGVLVVMVCSRETRNLAELTPEQMRNNLLRDRLETSSRQLQRDLRRRAVIEMRDS